MLTISANSIAYSNSRAAESADITLKNALVFRLCCHCYMRIGYASVVELLGSRTDHYSVKVPKQSNWNQEYIAVSRRKHVNRGRSSNNTTRAWLYLYPSARNHEVGAFFITVSRWWSRYESEGFPGYDCTYQGSSADWPMEFKRADCQWQVDDWPRLSREPATYAETRHNFIHYGNQEDRHVQVQYYSRSSETSEMVMFGPVVSKCLRLRSIEKHTMISRDRHVPLGC